MLQASNRHILQEYLRREQLKPKGEIISLRDPSFHKQNEVLDAKEHRFKAINCTRRSGKSVGEAIDHIEIMQRFPGSRLVYGGLTLDSVTEIIWDVFLERLDSGNIFHKVDKTHRIIRLSNESRVRLFGVDASEKEMRKVLGQKLRKASIDEAGSITVDMVKLCYQMIMPTLTDLRPFSWLTLLGTCENIPGTFFEDVTEGRERGVDWRVFKWTAYDNPHMKRQWTEEIDDLKKNNPKVVEASWFQTHYLNMWVTDDNLIIYDLRKATCSMWNKNQKALFILAVDLGYNDATAFSIIGFSMKNNKSNLVYSKKETQMDFTDIEVEIIRLKALFQKEYSMDSDFYKYIVDGSNKQGVEEMRKRKGIPFESAEKQDKSIFMRLMYDDIKTSTLELSTLDENENAFVKEAKSLIWEDENKEKEDARCENHACDATLYAWRYAYNYLYRKEEAGPKKGSEEWHLRQEQEIAERERREREEDSFI